MPHPIPIYANHDLQEPNYFTLIYRFSNIIRLKHTEGTSTQNQTPSFDTPRRVFIPRTDVEYVNIGV